jgi:hypothetical protein
MSILNRIKFEHLVTSVLISYLPFHLLEEGLFGFPAWAENYWRIPNYTIEKWIFHNFFFLFGLLIGYIVYRLDKNKYLSAGTGIILWGVMNTLNHILCSIIFTNIEPGIISSILFLGIGIIAVWKLRKEDKLSIMLLGLSLLWNLLYWGVPIFAFIIIPGVG